MSNKLLLVIVGVIVIIGIGVIFGFFQGGNMTVDPNNPNQTAQGELKREDLKVGDGQEVKSGDSIVVHYKGMLTNGEQFDASYDRNEPFEVQIGTGSVIAGWDQGIPGMKVGGKRKLTIPPHLAYGEDGVGSIPPNATLVFEIELLEIK